MRTWIFLLTAVALCAGTATAGPDLAMPGGQPRGPSRDNTIYWLDDIETGAPGWWTRDNSVGADPHFHADTYMAYAGTHSWWCGNFDYDADGGYGNNWDDRLALPPVAWGGAVYPVLTFAYRCDSELNYDITWVQAESLAHWSNLHGGYSGETPWTEDGYYLGLHDNPAKCRFRFVSDGHCSDEDGDCNSVGGSFMCDNIKIWDYYTGQELFYDPVDGTAYGCCTRMESYDDWPLFECFGSDCNEYVNAQSFSPTESYELCGVGMPLNTAWPGVPQTATVSIQDGPGAGATVFATGSRDDISSSALAGRWYDVDTEPDINVTADETYYIRVTGEVMWYEYYDDPGDPYPRGIAYLGGIPHEDYTPQTTDHYDFWFRTYTYGYDCPIGQCQPEGKPVGGDYWHIVEDPAAAWSDPHCWWCGEEGDTAHVPPNVDNSLFTPLINISSAYTCTVRFFLHPEVPPEEGDYWMIGGTVDGVNYYYFGSWWGDVGTASGWWDRGLQGFDLTSLGSMPYTVAGCEFRFVTDDDGCGPGAGGGAGIAVDDTWLEGQVAAEVGTTVKTSWGLIKSLYRD